MAEARTTAGDAAGPRARRRRRTLVPGRLLVGGAALGAAAWLLRSDGGRRDPDAWRSAAAALDTPVPFGDGVWTVESRLPGAVGRVFPARMTVLRLPDGGLLLHSPTRWSASLQAALEAEGPIRHLVAPNVAHWMFVSGWQNALPDAITWGSPRLGERGPVRRSGLRIDRVLGDDPPPEWQGAVRTVTVEGAFGFREVALFHEDSGTLVLTDLMMDLGGPDVPVAARPVLAALGATAPDRMALPHLRAVVRLRGAQPRDAARRLFALAPRRIVFAHGMPVGEDAAASLRRSLSWLVPGAAAEMDTAAPAGPVFSASPR